MKTPHLAGAILAASALMAQSNASDSMVLNLDFRPNYQGYFPELIRHQSARRSGDLPGSHKKKNQNKTRKNRRRAFAAGNRKAFSH